MAERKRSIYVAFWISEQERELIQQKMALMGTTNMSAYIRKMAIDGYAVTLNLPELKEILRLLRYTSNNLNQLARRANETGRIYDTDIDDLIRSHAELKDDVKQILERLSRIS